MPTGPQEIVINSHADFDAMVLGLPPVDGVRFSHPAVEHDTGRWFDVALHPEAYNAVVDRTETMTSVAYNVRVADGLGGRTVLAWGPRPATLVEIQLMARLAVAAYAAYGDDSLDDGAPLDVSQVRLT